MEENSRPDVAVSMASHAYKAASGLFLPSKPYLLPRPSLAPFNTKLAKIQCGSISCFGLPSFKMVVQSSFLGDSGTGSSFVSRSTDDFTLYPEPLSASGAIQLLSPFPLSVSLFQHLAVVPRKEMVVPRINMASTTPLRFVLGKNGIVLASMPV